MRDRQSLDAGAGADRPGRDGRGARAARASGTVELAEFFHAPKSADEREHVLAPNEFVLVGRHSRSSRLALTNASYEVRHKQSYDWPLVQAAVAFTSWRTARRRT